ncbi:MAG: F0F1 ATP synthase subunit delta [Acidobacteriota bacterium]
MKQNSRHHLAEVIGKRTLKIKDRKQLVREIAAYLLLEHHTAELGSLVRDVMQYRAEHGIVEAVAVSAHGLSDRMAKDVEKILKEAYPSAKEVIVRERQDENVVGGIRIELANDQLDLTVRSKLSKFKRLTSVGKE